MKYTVSINEKSKAIVVTLPDGTTGTAKCSPTDRFDINTGIELALERAKVAKKNAEAKKAESNTPNLEGYGNIMKLVKALEKALPKGQMVIVGNGTEMTEKQKAWLRSLAGGCSCKCHEVDEDEIYDRGYAEGYGDGYTAAEAEYDDSEAEEIEAALARIREILDEVGFVI